MNNVYDVIIVGGGPSGLTCGIYTSRENLRTLILEKEVCGGLAGSTHLIENYPGFPEGLSGEDLLAKFKAQAQKFGTEIREFTEVEEIIPQQEVIEVKTSKENFFSFSVVIAGGSQPKKLGVKGEEEFRGRGVSYCATCDGPLFKDKDVVVVGCGNSGLQEGEALLKYVNSLTFVEFLPFITAQKILQERIKKDPKAKFLLNHKVIGIEGEDFVKKVIVEDRETGKIKEIPAQGVFIYAGYLPNTGFLKGLLELDEQGFIITDEKMRTSLKGIFACGDIRSKEVRQITTAVGEATISAISVRDYLREVKNS